MHILYIHQHFATPKGSTATRSYEFARRWVKAGHKVTLITGRWDIGGLEAGRGFISRQNVEGIDVVVVGTKYSNKQSYLRRIVSFVWFMVLGIYGALRTRYVDVVYATSTPLTVGIPAMVAKWLKGVPFVFEVRDQWPISAVEVGAIKNKFLIKILSWLESIIYKNSSAIVALSDGMADGIRQVAGQRKLIYVVPNCAALDFFRPDIDGSSVRQRKGWDDKLVFLQAGSMGRSYGLDFVIDAAEKLKEHHDIVFVLIGQGSQRPGLEKKVQELGLTNVEILPPVPKQQLPEFFAAADVGLVIIGLKVMEKHASLNKFYDGLSSGKPMLLNYYGWQGRLIEDNNAGYGCQFRDIDRFVERVLYIKTNRNRLPEMGKNARLIAETQFDSNKLAVQALSVLEATLNR